MLVPARTLFIQWLARTPGNLGGFYSLELLMPLSRQRFSPRRTSHAALGLNVAAVDERTEKERGEDILLQVLWISF